MGHYPDSAACAGQPGLEVTPGRAFFEKANHGEPFLKNYEKIQYPDTDALTFYPMPPVAGTITVNVGMATPSETVIGSELRIFVQNSHWAGIRLNPEYQNLPALNRAFVLSQYTSGFALQLRNVGISCQSGRALSNLPFEILQ